VVVVRRLAALAAVCCVGCEVVRAPTVPTSGTPQEELVLRETARFAGVLAVKARGELTELVYRLPAGSFGCPQDRAEGCLASGWWDPPVAYYYRPHVVTWDLALVTDVAAHETCHAIERGHNPLHLACCSKLGARPTYALGADGLVAWEGVALR
jgi:hypothetical protein